MSITNRRLKVWFAFPILCSTGSWSRSVGDALQGISLRG